MTEREDFTFRGVTPNTECRTIPVRLTLLLTLLASCLTFAPAASAQVWQSDLKVADLVVVTAKGCGMGMAPCSTQLSNPSFRFDGETYQIVLVALSSLYNLDSPYLVFSLEPWSLELFERLAELWKLCVNSTAFSLKDVGIPGPGLFPGLKWPYPHDFWEIGDSVRLTITSGSCP